MTLLDASKKYYVVGYDYLSGEHGIPKQKLIVGEEGETKDEILDSYFGDFFGEGTYKDKDCARYFDKYGEQVITISSLVPVPVEDAVIIKKYFLY